MSMKRLLLEVGAAAALMTTAACMTGPTGAAAEIAMAGQDMPAPPAMEFARMAAASDAYEIQSSQILLQTTQNDELRRFASMMIEHHTTTTATLARQAEAAGMTPPPPQLDSRKAEMIRQLQAAEGEQRDRLYVQQQVMAHDEALRLHSSYAKAGDAPELRVAATAAVPFVSQHYNTISQIQARMGGM